MHVVHRWDEYGATMNKNLDYSCDIFLIPNFFVAIFPSLYKRNLTTLLLWMVLAKVECAGLDAKDARLNFSHQPLLLGNHWSTKGGFLDIMYLLHWTEIQHRFCFFHSCLDGYLDSDIFQHTKHPNMDLYKAKVVLIVLTKQTLPLICAHEVPCAEDEDYVFCCELVFFIFFPSPLNIFAQFLLTKFYLPKLYLE